MAEAAVPDPPRRILVVDDEPELLDELITTLSLEGWHADGAPNGREALRHLAEDDSITVLLTDIRMPGISGLELASQAWHSRRDIDAVEVVLLTGHGTVEDAAQAVRIGAFDFVSKPVGVEQLLAVCERAYQASSRRRLTEATRIAELERLRTERETLRARLAHAPDTTDFSAGVPHELSGILSHELRTPLIALMAVPELLSSGGNLPAADVAENMGIVRQAGARLMRIAEDFVEFLAPPDPATFQIRPVQPALVLRQVQAAFRDAAVAVVDGETIDAVLETDLPRLVRALERLVANAVAWTPPDGTVRLSARAIAPELIAFEVTDTGRGMTETEVAVALLPFRQVDMSHARRVGGLGLGLPLAARMAERLGGELKLDSKAGEGTRAAIVLPRRHLSCTSSR